MGDETAGMTSQRTKKLPFKPTALRNSTASLAVATATLIGTGGKGKEKATDVTPNNTMVAVDSDGLDLFRRAKEMAPIVAADQERRWRKKQRQKEEEQRTRKTEERRDSVGGKRALIIDEALDEKSSNSPPPSSNAKPLVTGRLDYDSEQSTREVTTTPRSKRSKPEGNSSAVQTNSNKGDVVDLIEDSPSTRSRTRLTHEGNISMANIANFVLPPSTEIIPIESASDDDESPIVFTEPKQNAPSYSFQQRDVSPDVFDVRDEDDEFADYVRQAKEQRAKDLLRASQQALDAQGACSDGSTAKEVIDILLTSTVPDTHDFCVKFVYDKALRIVRDSWVARQRQKGIQLSTLNNNSDDDGIILTWRRQKVYMSSTLRSLGIRPAPDGGIVLHGQGDPQGVEQSLPHVHLEAWTSELFDQMQRDEEIRRKREAGDLSEENEAGDAGADTQQVEDIKLRIILKPRELEAVKLIVRPETNVDTILTAFRTQRHLATDVDVSLWFDGERLQGDTTMEDADIDNMDTLEVHIK